jgi:tetratricopeptide (TPR) repeat protein
MNLSRSSPSGQFYPRFHSPLAVFFFLVTLVLGLNAQVHKPEQRSPKPAPPDTLQQHYDAARTFQLAGDQDHAAAEYQAFLGEALRRIANTQTRAADLAGAAASFEEALKFSPDSLDLNLDYASLLTRQAKFPEATARVAKGLQLKPESARAHTIMGRLLFEQEDYKGAREQLEKAASTEASFEVGYFLGITYLKLGEPGRTENLFNEMVAGLGDTAQIHMSFARAYRTVDNYDHVIQEIQKAIAKDPKLLQSHYFLAMAYLGRDNDSGFPEAIPEFRAELQLNPGDYRSHYMLGFALLKQHDTAGAERESLQAISLNDHNPDPWVNLAQLYMESGRKPEAMNAARKAISLTQDASHNDYDISRAHYLLGRLLLEAGQREDGSKELAISEDLRKQRMQHQAAQQAGSDTASLVKQEKQSDTPEATASPEVRAQSQAYIDGLRPAVSDAYNNLGVTSVSKKDFSTALAYFEKAASWNPGLEQADRNIGMAAFYGQAYDKAIVPLLRELHHHPNDVRVRAALALSYFSSGDYAGTLQILSPIEEQVNADPGLLNAYGVSLIKTGRYDDGMAHLKTLETANPNSADVHLVVGDAFAEQGIYGPAIEEYRKAIVLDPNQQRAHYLLGLALIRQGGAADAMPELQAALKLNPADLAAKYQLAFAMIQTGAKIDAVPLLNQVIAQDKNYADAYYQLGKLQLEQGDTKPAIQNLETASKLSPQSEYMHYQLAQAYRRDSRTDDAEREMQQYQSLKDHRRGNHESPQSN